MQQVYHSNAVTNIHIRHQIKESSLTNFQLSVILQGCEKNNDLNRLKLIDDTIIEIIY